MRTTNSCTQEKKWLIQVQGDIGACWIFVQAKGWGVEGKGHEVCLIYNYLEIDHNYEIIYRVIAWGLINMKHL